MNIAGYLAVCLIAALCIAWWWRNMKATAWEYTIYVAVILILLFPIVFA